MTGFEPTGYRLDRFKKLGIVSKWLYYLLYRVDSNLYFILIGVFVSLAINLLTGLMVSFPCNPIHIILLILSILFSAVLCVSFSQYAFLHKDLNDDYQSLRNDSTPLPAVVDYIFDHYYEKRHIFLRKVHECMLEILLLIVCTAICLVLANDCH